MSIFNKGSMLKKWINGTGMSLLVMNAALAPAYASDTEVYARTIEVSSGDITPVLMMVLDSSGSMNFCMDGTEYCEYPNQMRTEVLRNAMYKVLFGNPVASAGPIIKPSPQYIKMGYARFNPVANDGGWSRYPARELGSYVPYEDAEWTAEPRTVETRLLGSADDAVGSDITGASYTVGGTADVGLRFADLQVPQGATITGATLTFYHAPNPGTIPNSLRVRLEESDDALPYSALNTPTSVLRSYANATSPSTVVPSRQDTFVTGVVSVSVTRQVQELVSRSGWCGGNAMGLLVSADPSASGSFAALSWDGVDATTRQRATLSTPVGTMDGRPRLVVSYTISRTADTCINAPVHAVTGIKDTLDDVEWTSAADSVVRYDEQELQPAAIPSVGETTSSGLRFPSAQILNGATIEGAWLYLTAAEGGAAANVTVSAYDSDNFPAFCSRDGVTKIVTCSKPTAPLLASPTATLAMPTAVGQAGTNLVVDVTSLVAAVANRTTWSPASSIGFHLTNADPASTGSLAELYAMGAGLSKVAVLHVKMRKRFDNMARYVKTIRQDLYEDIALRMYADGGTPLGDAYAEAARYMMGMATLNNNPSVITTSFGGLTPSQSYYHPDRRMVGTDNLTYQSPIVTGECTANYLYMMSDGEPSNRSNVANNSNGITGGYNADCNAYSNDALTGDVAKSNFICMMAVAKHMSSALNQQATKVRTNTVFFDSRAETDPAIVNIVHDMKKVAEHGEGAFFLASDEGRLTESMSKTLTALLDQTGSITAPGVAVNQFNRLTHLDQLYYAVFDPDTGRARWRGNVKRYRLDFTSTDARIVDKNNNPAIDEGSTFFAEDSHSFWSPTQDGNTAVLGGVASVLPDPALRNIYTYLAPSYTTNMSLGLLRSVAAADGRPYVPGLTADRQFTNLRNWLQGYDIDIVQPATATTPVTIKSTTINVGNSTPRRKIVGGVLHSQPVLVNFGYTGTDPAAAQTNPDLQDNMVFFSTMEGMLHAANARTGVESFAFMPKEALAVSPALAINPDQSLPQFGLDLTWTVHRVDANADLMITGNGDSGAANDKVWLYGGMRMGGRNYYAMNVTNRTAPKLKWVIEGGTGVFANLGETWSKPVVGQIKINGTITDVLFFGGGYDREHEADNFDATIHAGNARGSQFYIVNADTGAPIWWASSTSSIGTTPHLTVAEMKFSIPGEPKLFDANKDGLVDAVYFGDLGGQVFRLDLNNANTAASGLVPRVHRLANVGQLEGTANEANQRRFYETPSVALMFDSASSSEYVAVAIGSGSRSRPLDSDTEDAFFVFRDGDVLRADLATAASDSLQATITRSDLAQLDLSSPLGATISATQKGWWVDFVNSGEKVLSTPLILFGEVFFTTYQPLVDSGDPCSPLIGKSFLWRMSVTDGAATFDFNKNGSITAADRNEEAVNGLGGSPQLLIGEDGKNAIITGTGVERNKDLEKPTMRRTRWYEKMK